MSSLRQILLLPTALFVLLCAATFSPISYYQTGSLGVDDSNIFFTFAKNFLNGEGLIWNSSEGPVEGYTSTLWLLVCVAAQSLSDRFEALLLFANIALLAAALSCFIASFKDALRSSGYSESAGWFAGGTVALLCLSNPGYLSWSIVSLMDTGLWSAALLLAVCAAQNSVFSKAKGPAMRGFAIALALLVLTRPEGAPAAFALLGYSGLLLLRLCGSPAAAARRLAPALAAVTATLGGLTGFRLWYFGYPFPNTYYAKVGSSLGQNLQAGSSYFYTWLTDLPLIGLAVAAAIPICIVAAKRLFFGKHEEPNPLLYWTVANSGLFLLGCSLYVYLGGDHFPLSRQLQPFWPLACMVSIAALLLIGSRIDENGRRNMLATTALIALTASFYSSTNLSSSADMEFEYQLTKFARATGVRLTSSFPETAYPRVGAIAVGGIGYTYRGELVDLMGIVNEKMAHASREREGLKNHAAFHIPTFYQLAPELIVHFGPSCRLKKGFENDTFIKNALKQLPTSEKFRSLYVKLRMRGTKPAVCGFALRSFAEQYTGEQLRFFNW